MKGDRVMICKTVRWANLKEAQKLYIELTEQDDAKKFFETETKFNILIADVNKIIGEAIQDVLK